MRNETQGMRHHSSAPCRSRFALVEQSGGKEVMIGNCGQRHWLPDTLVLKILLYL
jgi:hypothetical protein